MYQEHILNHEIAVNGTTGVNVVNIKFNEIPKFRDAMFKSSQGKNVEDVAETNHSKETGTVYVQCAKAKADNVRRVIKTCLKQFPGAYLPESDGSVRTQNTRMESASAATSLPPNRYVEALKLIGTTINVSSPTTAAAQIPRTISTETKPKKMFSEFMAEKFKAEADASSSDSNTEDDDSDITEVRTNASSSIGTNKTAYEVQLEERNDELFEENRKLQSKNTELNNKMEQMAVDHKAEILASEERINERIMRQVDLMFKQRDTNEDQREKTMRSPSQATPQHENKKFRLETEENDTGKALSVNLFGANDPSLSSANANTESSETEPG